MRIQALYIKDFKRLKTVRLSPDPTLVILTGRNAQGKSSVLDAIESVICGEKYTPARPVRSGKEKAEVSLDLGEYRVCRKWDGNKSRLILENADETRPKSPQAILTSMFSRVAADPDEFVRMEPKKQAAILRKIAGIEDEMLRIDAQIAVLTEERKETTRAINYEEGMINGFPTEAELKDVPDEAPSMAALVAQFEAMSDDLETNRKLRASLEREKREYLKANEKLGKTIATREIARQALELAEAEVVKAEEESKVAEEALEESSRVVEELADPDTAAIKAQMDSLESIAVKVRLKKERVGAVERWTEHREASSDLTRKIQVLNDEKSVQLSLAKFPIPGLDVTDDDVRLNGVPLEQASSAQKIRLGLAVAAALRPDLRVAIIRNGSLLDEEAINEIPVWAEENDFQVWLEIVGTPESQEGVVIEDGEVIADRQQPTERKKKPTGKPEQVELLGFAETERQAEEVF